MRYIIVDHDVRLTLVLATVEVDGEPMPLAIGSGKTGTVIAANAESGAVIWETNVGKHNAYGDGAPLPEPSATPVTVLPGPFGGVLSPLAYAEGTLFVPVINAAFSYSDTTDRRDLEQTRGEMVALNAGDGSICWRTEVETFFASGATVANDLVFGAGLDGFARAFDPGTCREVWRFRAGAGINAPLAIAREMLLVPAGGPFYSEQVSPPPAQNELIALRLGAEPATPIA